MCMFCVFSSYNPKKINDEASPWWLHLRPNWQPCDRNSQPWKTEDGMDGWEDNMAFFCLSLCSETKQVRRCVRYYEKGGLGSICVLKAHLQCMMEEWCSPYSSWLSLMKGCSADRPPPSAPPPPPQLLLLDEEEESGGSPQISARGSTSPASPFFSGVWREHMEGCCQCQWNQRPVPLSIYNSRNKQDQTCSLKKFRGVGRCSFEL